VSDVSAAKIDVRLLDITFLTIPVSYKAATFLFFFCLQRRALESSYPPPRASPLFTSSCSWNGDGNKEVTDTGLQLFYLGDGYRVHHLSAQGEHKRDFTTDPKVLFMQRAPRLDSTLVEKKGFHTLPLVPKQPRLMLTLVSVWKKMWVRKV
jgi:hypothetical protein